MGEDKPVSDPEAPARRRPASGERGDHQASPPGVAIPGNEDEPEDETAAEEPEPGDHPAP